MHHSVDVLKTTQLFTWNFWNDKQVRGLNKRHPRWMGRSLGDDQNLLKDHLEETLSPCKKMTDERSLVMEIFPEPTEDNESFSAPILSLWLHTPVCFKVSNLGEEKKEKHWVGKREASQPISHHRGHSVTALHWEKGDALTSRKFEVWYKHLDWTY